MSADVALDPGLRASLYPFCRLTGPANVLVMPGLHAAHILARSVPRLTSATVIGPLLTGLSHSGRSCRCRPGEPDPRCRLPRRPCGEPEVTDGPILTIGYEHGTPAGLITALTAGRGGDAGGCPRAGQQPQASFAKGALSAALAEAGIGYRHMRALGTPAEGRAAVRAGRPEVMRRIFGAHLAGTEAQAALADLSDLARRERVCLLCLEADPRHCHRSLVAEAVGLPVTHLHPA